MASLMGRVTAPVTDLRQRRPLVDHAIRTQAHYSGVKAGQQAGAVAQATLRDVYQRVGFVAASR